VAHRRNDAQTVPLGAVAQSSLILSGLVVYGVTVPAKVIGALVGFGSGALIAAIAFDLIPESNVRPLGQAALWLLIGAVVFVVSDRIVEAKFASEKSSGPAPLGIVVGGLWIAVPVGVQGDAAGNDTAATGPAGLTHQARHNGSPLRGLWLTSRRRCPSSARSAATTV
jgi:hypothetical protein